MPSKKRATPVSLQPLDALFGTNEESINGISEIAIGSLHPFPNHPFQVRDDKKMEELSESIIQYGVLVPGIVRLRESGGYELVAGHRRKRACELAGLEKMPVIIKDLTDDESTVIMVDSNIQRENIQPSEKAKAYKIKYDAMKNQVTEIDFQALVSNEKVHSVAEVVLLNHEKVLDGILQQKLEEISYKALPAALVDRIEIDVESMKIGDAVLVKDLAIASNPDIDLMTDPEAVVVTVTRVHNAPAEEETEETDADAAADTKKDAAKKEEK